MLRLQNYGRFLYPPDTKVVVTHNDYETKFFNYENNYESESLLYGHSLIDILLSESEIKLNFESNQLVLSKVITSNPHSDVTRLIGSIAEILVTKFCKEYQEVNRRLGMYGRCAEKLSNSIDNYVAVATGSQQTRYYYPTYYNPNDTQRDIIWVHKESTEHQLLCVGATTSHGKPAGIQVKTSHNYQYVLSSIEKYHYPILYFDLSNDWYQLYHSLDKSDYLSRLIPHDDITNEIKQFLLGYFKLLIPIFTGEKNLQYLIDMSKYEGYVDILKGLELANNDGTMKILIPK